MPPHPRSHQAEQEAAHDVLAAEAFAVPAPDPELRQGRVVLPEDPSGIAEPHDILAAEEFAMPAVKGGPGPDALTRRAALARRAESPWSWVLAAAGALVTLVGLSRRARR